MRPISMYKVKSLNAELRRKAQRQLLLVGTSSSTTLLAAGFQHHSLSETETTPYTHLLLNLWILLQLLFQNPIHKSQTELFIQPWLII